MRINKRKIIHALVQLSGKARDSAPRNVAKKKAVIVGPRSFTFHILTLFPEVFSDYFSASILGRAVKNKIIKLDIQNLRKWAADKRGTVDDRPYGGGAGMVLKFEPIYKAVKYITSKFCPSGTSPEGRQILSPWDISRRETNSKFNSRVILFSTRGKIFNEKEAIRLSRYNNLIFICGRYEGVDERVAKYVADEEISVGDFILSGGEIPAMVVADAVSRLVPGVLGKYESLENIKGSYPVYTKPECLKVNKKNLRVPKVLLSGNHKKIDEWRKKNQQLITNN